MAGIVDLGRIELGRHSKANACFRIVGCFRTVPTGQSIRGRSSGCSPNRSMISRPSPEIAASNVVKDSRCGTEIPAGAPARSLPRARSAPILPNHLREVPTRRRINARMTISPRSAKTYDQRPQNVRHPRESPGPLRSGLAGSKRATPCELAAIHGELSAAVHRDRASAPEAVTAYDVDRAVQYHPTGTS